MTRALNLLAILVVAAVARSAGADELPKAVTHTVLPSGQHRYEIQGLYEGGVRANASAFAEDYSKEMPGCTDLTINPANRAMIFTTDSPVSTLREYVDRFARGGGVVPYWEELEMRDRKSVSFESSLYSLAYDEALPWSDDSSAGLFSFTNTPAGLRLTFCSNRVDEGGKSYLLDFVLSASQRGYQLQRTKDRRSTNWDTLEPVLRDKRDLSLPLRYSATGFGSVGLNKTTAFCMDYSRFALRIFDAKGKYLWEDQTHVFGTCYLAVADLNGDKIDEIVVYQEEHGRMRILIFGRQK